MYDKPTKKSFGQHFLTDQYYIDRLLHMISPRKSDYFVEIGPGSGCLTDHLLPNCKQLEAIEIDSDCVDFLKKKYVDSHNFHVTRGDFLSFDYKKLLSQHYRWVGNLPYNVSVPILLALMQKTDLIQDGIFLLQKEVAQRCCAQVGEKHYGRLGIALQCVFEVSSCLSIPPHAFSPPPKVDSEVICITPHQKESNQYLNTPNFTAVLSRSFAQRRKMMRKIFHGLISDRQWQDMGIDSRLRPENISPRDFHQIACCLRKDSE